MIDFTLQLLLSLLIIGGMFYIVVESYVKLDRVFLFFGIALVLFGLIPAIDIWVLPRSHAAGETLLWIRVQHILTVLLLPLVLWYLKNFLKSRTTYLHLVVNVFVVFFSVVLFSDASLRAADGAIVRGPLYHFLFLPCFAATGCFVIFLIAARLKGTIGNERRILFYHLIGFSLLCSFGLIDLMVKATNQSFAVFFHSFFILGIFAFGLMTFLIFTERLLMLVNDRRKAYEQLGTALREMEEASTLRQIGESASIINHEIKNYLCRIFGSVELLQISESLSDEGKQEIDIIKRTVQELQSFSMDILQLSRARIIKEKEMLTVVPLLRQCIASYFPERKQSITIRSDDDRHTIHGEWGKLEHVFVNILKNSFEAEATAVDIAVRSTGSVLLIAITDNGTGCPADQISEIFKAFYTTKKGQQGTGLGMSISRAVVESHGGHISAYTKNDLGNSAHGVQVAITFPQYGQEETGKAAGKKEEIVLLREGIQDMPSLLQVFRNVHMYPSIIPSTSELERSRPDESAVIIAADASLPVIQKSRSIRTLRVIPVLSRKGITYARTSPPAMDLELFSEVYVIDRLVKAG
ncbi:MAG: HAMP domain-containing histidine kinase [Chitinispirillaceae bacterium]|nr:HAMP domain-containing histidine kinase [Chitinispirillaceae bacterium]